MRHSTKAVGFGAGILVLSLGMSVFAGGDAPTNAMEEIVVTATRMATPYSQVPASVSVVAGKDVQSPAVRNVDDALRNLDGISMLRSYGMGHGIPNQINIRGVPGLHRTLLLADGIPLVEASSGFMSANEIPVNTVQRVEVVRGPFSALYGTDALSGVINILTYDPGEGPTLESSVQAGNEGYYQGSLRASGGTLAKGWTLSMSGRTIDNYVARDTIIASVFNPTTYQIVEVEKPADNYEYEDSALLAKLTMDLGKDSHMNVHVRLFDSALGYGMRDLVPLYPVPVESDTENRTALVGADLTTRVSDDLRTRLAGFYREQKRQMWGLDGAGSVNGMPVFAPSYSENAGDDWKLDAGAQYRIAPQHTLVAGADFHQIRCDFSPVENRSTGLAITPMSVGKDASTENVGLYLQEESRFADAVSVVPGVRVDIHSEFGTALSPRLGMSVDLGENTSGHASVGRAYRAPTLIELFQPDIAYGSILFQSNPDLEPEYITTVDAGLEQEFAGAVKAHWDVFYNDMEDLIVDSITGSSTLTYRNVSQAWSAGTEVGLDWQAVKELGVFGNYAYQQSEDEDVGGDLEYTPDHMANAGVRVGIQTGAWKHEATLTGHYVGTRDYLDLQTGQRRTLDAYVRTDASLRFTYRDWIWIGAGAQNLFDETYQESSSLNPAPGILWSLELGARM